MKAKKYGFHILLLVMGLFVSSAFWINDIVAVFSEATPVKRAHCIIIDPGHGGIDGGASSCTGVLESQLNLEIGLRLHDLLCFLGFDTKMVRTEDISIHTSGESIAQKKISDLKERVKICNETDGAILVSIHQNYFSNGRYNGAQVFYAESEESKSFAKMMQKDLKRILNPENKRESKPGQGIYLLEHIQCPGILIECGFLSNPEEESLLRSEEYQKKLCCVIAANTVRFALDAQTND